MKKNILTVLSSFFGVGFVIMLGTNIIYRAVIVPKIKEDYFQENKNQETIIQKKESRIQQLESDLATTIERQKYAEKKLQEKLDEEERIARQKAQEAEEARLAAQAKAEAEAKAKADAKAKAAAVAARKAAEKKASKKSKAS